MKRRTRKLGSYRPLKAEQLRMTSLMDILVVLLLFLIKSFVADGQILTPTPGVDLPTSSADETPEESLVISIFDDSILLGDEEVARLSDSMVEGRLLIEDLATRLQQVRVQREDLQRRRGDDEADAGRVTIQGDRQMQFEVLRRVMYTLSYEGFSDVSLAVIHTS